MPPREPLPADQRPILHVTRTGDAAAREIALTASKHLDTLSLGATLDVVDTSPFPRICPRPGGCVMVELPPLP